MSNLVVEKTGKRGLKRFGPKRGLLFLLITFFLVGTGIAVYQLQNQSVQMDHCEESVIKKASEFMIYEKNSQLTPIADSIRQKKGYEQDVNCMYIVTINSMHKLDYQSAKQDYEKLAKKYVSVQDLNINLRRNAKSKDDMIKFLVFLEKKDQEYKTNMGTFSQPE